jgi:hypothetical protein
LAEFDLMAAAVQLAAEFRRRNMDTHLACLRQFYADQRRRKKARQRSGDKTWDENMVIQWLGLLRIPPFRAMYPCLPRESPCPKCGAAVERSSPPTFVRSVWPGGCLKQCRRCETSWLNDETADGESPRVSTED